MEESLGKVEWLGGGVVWFYGLVDFKALKSFPPSLQNA